MRAWISIAAMAVAAGCGGSPVRDKPSKVEPRSPTTTKEQTKHMTPLARAVLERAAQVANDVGEHFARNAVALVYAKEYRDAAALALRPDLHREQDAYTWATLAQLYGMVGNAARVEALRSRIHAAGKQKRYAGWLAIAYEWLGDDKTADELMMKEDPESRDWMELGLIATQLGDMQRVAVIAERVRTEEPDFVSVLYKKMAAHYLSIGKQELAAAALGEAVTYAARTDAQTARGWASLATLYRRLGKPRKALEMAKKAERVAATHYGASDGNADPKRGDVLPHILRGEVERKKLGWFLDVAEIYRVTGDRQRSMRIWASYERPQDIDAPIQMAWLARARAQHGYKAKARRWLEAALAATKKKPEEVFSWAAFYYAVVRTHLYLDEVATALDYAAAIKHHRARIDALLAIAEHCQQQRTRMTPAIRKALRRVASTQHTVKKAGPHE